MGKSLIRLWFISLLIAWSFDYLFWEKSPGISFAVFVILLLIGGMVLSALEKHFPPLTSLLLLLPLGFFAAMSYIRMEPFTTFVNILLCLIFLAIIAFTYLSGRWLQYGWADYAIRLFRLGISALVKPIQAWDKRLKDAPAVPATTSAGRRRALIPVLRGLLLALPVVLVFGTLLSSADPIFGQGIEDFFAILKIENLPEYLFRLAYILIGGYLLVGIYLHALTTTRNEHLYGKEKPLVPRLLGFTEAAIVLGSVVTLFAIFVGVQFRYFFGGQANIHIDGYTYSEYARRGFAELVLVAIFTLLLFLVLSSLTKRISHGQQVAFSALGIALTALICVILTSGYQRLLLYEAAYGFSRLRTYTHIFMIWLGVLLAVLMLLELIGKLRAFALASILVAVGFGVTLNLLPVDSLIARQNILRSQNGSEIDTQYLVALYPDVVPSLWQKYNDPQLEVNLQDQIGGVLACQAAIYTPSDLPWQSFHLSRYRAERLIDAHQDELTRFDANQDEFGNWTVTVDGQQQPCMPGRYMD